MLSHGRRILRDALKRIVLFLERRGRDATRPTTTLLLGALADHVRSPGEIAAENQLLRHQLVVIRRQIQRPRLSSKDRLTLLLLARRTTTWASALFLVRPDSLLRWHREGFRLLWRRNQGLGQQIPEPLPEPSRPANRVIATPVLGGLHHDYRLAA